MKKEFRNKLRLEVEAVLVTTLGKVLQNFITELTDDDVVNMCGLNIEILQKKKENLKTKIELVEKSMKGLNDARIQFLHVN